MSGPDRQKQEIEGLKLVLQVFSDLQVIGGEADRISRGCPDGDPRKQESDRIRREVATLQRYIAEVVIWPTPLS